MLKNLLEYEKREDTGELAENFVFLELERLGKEVKYWRTKSGGEVDFIIEEKDGIIPIEVKLRGSKALGKSFYNFIKTHKTKRALVVTLDELSKRKINGITIYSVPIFYL
jgi:predicted AAA+ superfamily ATPase